MKQDFWEEKGVWASRVLYGRANPSPESEGKKDPDPSSSSSGEGGQPNKNNDDENDDKISALLLKAFLWMLTAYMFIAIVSLLFPGSNQPEVFLITITHIVTLFPAFDI